MKSCYSLLLSLCFALLLAASGTTDAASYTWNGGGAGWSSSGNWTPASPAGGLTTGNDDAVFDTTATANFTTTLVADQSVKSVTFNNSTNSYTVRLFSTTGGTIARTLTVGGGGITVTAGNHTILGAKPGSGTAGSLQLSSSSFNIASGNTLTFDARLRQSGSGLLYTKSGQGTLVFNGDSSGTTGWSFNGFTVSQGVLRFTASGAFGTSGNDYTINSGGSLEVSGGVSQNVAAGGSIALSGTGISGNGALRSVSGANVFTNSGDIILAADSTIGVDADSLSIAPVISGLGRNLTKVGAGTLTLSGANTYSGTTNISAGTLALGSAGSINNSTGLAIAAGATFDVSAIASYSLSASTTLGASGTGTTAGTDAAIIKGGTTVSMGSQPVMLAWGGATSGVNATTPCLLVSQGALTLNNNVFTINGPMLDIGTYTLVSVTGGTINGTPNPAPAGTAIDGTKVNFVSVSGGSVILTVASAASATATTTTVSRSSGSDPSTYGTTLVFKATVVPASGSIVPTGLVQFKANGVNFGNPVSVVTDSSPDGKAEISADTLPYNASPYTITAVYTPSDATFLPSSDLTGITQSITQAPVTVSGAAVQSKMFDGTTAATLTGTLVGVLPGDSANVAFNGTGTFASNGPGNGITVTVDNSTLTGSAAANYALTPPIGPLTGNILDTSIWGNPSGGLWNTTSNWSAATGNLVATGANNTADFNQVSLASDTTVSLNSPVTIGNLIFGNTAASPNSNWILNNNGTAANTLTLAATSPTVTVNDLGSGKSATISAVVGGTSGLAKSGVGTLVLSGANTYSGITTITQGTLQIGNGVSSTAGTLGNNSSATIASGATLRIDRYFLSGTTSTGDIFNYGGTLSGAGAVQIPATRRMDFSANQITSGNLSFSVDGLLAIRTVNGVTAVHLGELIGSGSIQRGSTASGAATLAIGGKNTSFTYAGIIGSAELGIDKVGSGKFTLTNTSSFGGTTTVTNGTLALGHATNTLPDVPPVSIGTAILEVGAACTDTIGTLDVTGAATIHLGDASSKLAFADSSAIDWTGGTLNITGSFTNTSIKFGASSSALTSGAGAQLSKITVNGSGTYTLDADGYLIPAIGGFTSWVTGTFANGTVPSGKQGPNDDADNDGISNLVEYAIAGQDPTVANSTIGTFDGTTLAFTKRGDATGLTYAIEESVSVGLSPTPWIEVTASPPQYINNTSTISYSFPVGGPGKNFLRLRVVAP